MDMLAYRFPQPWFLHIHGDDVIRYLNARLTADAAGLAIGAACGAAALTAQGKIELLCSVVRKDEASFFILCSGGEGIRSALGRMIVADRVNIDDKGDMHDVLHVAGDAVDEFLTDTLALSEPPLSDTAHITEHESFLIPANRFAKRGWDIALKRPQQDAFGQALREAGVRSLTEEEYLLQRLEAGKPTFPEDITPGSLLTEIDATALVARNKGCYVGQEVVEKALSLGKPPRRLCTVSFGEYVAIEQGAPLQASAHEKRPVGKVMNAAYHPGRAQTLCFAVMRTNIAALHAPVWIAANDGPVEGKVVGV